MLSGLVRSELGGLRQGPGWILAGGLLLVVVACSAAWAGGPAAPILREEAGLRELLALVVRVGALVALALGVSGVAGRRARRTLAHLLLAAPARWPVTVARLAVYTLAGAALAGLAVLAAVAVTGPWLAARDAGFRVTDPPVRDALAGGIVCGAGFAAVGVGLGTLLRDPFAALACALTWIAAADVFIPLLAPDVGRFLPGGALDGLIGAPVEGMLRPLPAGLVLLGYVTLAVAAGAAALGRRDIAPELDAA